MNHPPNLICSFEDKQWETWVPREKLSPIFEKEKDKKNDTSLIIRSPTNYASFGKWKCPIHDIEEQKTYRFSFDYRTKNIEYENMSLHALITWISSDETMITRDYMVDVTDLGDRWRRIYRTIKAPKDATAAIVELGLRWTKDGSVQWKNPIVTKTRPVQARKVKIATTYLKPHYDLTKNLHAMLDVIDKASVHQPDIICLSEVYYDRGVPLSFEEIETIPGNLTALISQKAKECGSYIVLCMKERDGDYLYVASLLIDRKGNIVGKYRKTHIPLDEAEYGISAATDYPVFETDFGKIGMLVCFDHLYPESAKLLVDQGAEIIFVPTIGDAPIQSRARAIDNGVHVVVSGQENPPSSRIVNPLGDIIGEVREEAQCVCVNEIDLSEKNYIKWFDVGAAKGEPHVVYKRQRRPDTY